jgi:hypothetical protein
MINYYMNLSTGVSLQVKGITFNSLKPESVEYTIRIPALSLPSLKEEIASPGNFPFFSSLLFS